MHYKRAKGVVKLHVVLDHDGNLPSYAVMTEGKLADSTLASSMTFTERTMLVLDCGYTDFNCGFS